MRDIALSQYRLEQTKPLLDSFANWLETQRAQAIPRTPLAEAIHYAINQWSTLTQLPLTPVDQLARLLPSPTH